MHLIGKSATVLFEILTILDLIAAYALKERNLLGVSYPISTIFANTNYRQNTS